jgi:uncharacterized repeat protein (TIGR03803 family)
MTKLNLCVRICAVLLLLATTAIGSSAQTFTTLHSFDGFDGNGTEFPFLVQGLDGSLYGTTVSGGESDGDGGGTVFTITTEGTFTTLHKFCFQNNCSGSKGPEGGVVQSTDGSFYGTTGFGGPTECGTVFEIRPPGHTELVHGFEDTADGCEPVSGLVQGTDGNFYGTTLTSENGSGTVFSLLPSRTLTTLYQFCSISLCGDGGSPTSGIVEGSNGDLYGTTSVGGAGNVGTVFRLTKRGVLKTLHSFDTADGACPCSALIQATDGNLYGTTKLGGVNGGGTVFTISPAGTLRTLYSFCAQASCADGKAPIAGLIQATDGNLYGTTELGGAVSSGTIFQITLQGTLKKLYDFCSQNNCTDGGDPFAGLVQATDGNFYGATSGGGSSIYGTIFSLGMELAPFVETLPASRKVGAPVYILGTNLTGATGVSFNGTAATFTIVSSSEIKTVVPTGTTTGFVTVTTPSGVLSSNVIFRVAP